MPYTPHTLVAFGGTISGITGKDQWQCGVRGGSFNTPAQPFGNSDAFISALQADLKTWFTTASSKMSPDATLDWLKINDIGADGKYLSLTTHRYDYSPPAAGLASTRCAPAYMSLAYTWETGFLRGRAHRGRIYPPNIGHTITKGSEVSATEASNAAATGELLLSKIVNASDVATTGADRFRPNVYSALDGTFRQITGVSVDTLYDEQHRRKEQTISSRSSVTLDVSTH